MNIPNRASLNQSRLSPAAIALSASRALGLDVPQWMAWGFVSTSFGPPRALYILNTPSEKHTSSASPVARNVGHFMRGAKNTLSK